MLGVQGLISSFVGTTLVKSFLNEYVFYRIADEEGVGVYTNAGGTGENDGQSY